MATDTGKAPAPPAQRAWRPVDIVSAAVIGVAGGVLLFLLNLAYGAAYTGLAAVYYPLEGIFTGLYLVPAVLGGLLIRKPGAALLTMVVAAVASMLLGNQWGFQTLWYGLLQGLGAELVFAALRYRRWGLVAAIGAAVGALAGELALSLPLFYAGVGLDQQLVRAGIGLATAMAVAGVGSWALMRALAATGALGALASGRAARRV